MSITAPRFKAIRFNRGDYLFKKGNPNEDVYFLLSGEVAFILPEYADAPFITLTKGEYCGDIDFVIDEANGRRVYTLKALEKTEAYFLNKNDLHELELHCKEIMLEFFD